MAMKIYIVNGRQCWYHEGEQPEGAEEVKPRKKARTVQNKSREDAETK